MDPVATLREMLDCFTRFENETQNRERFTELAEAYAGWRSVMGYEPEISVPGDTLYQLLSLATKNK